MAKVDPLYFALTRPVAPLGQGMRAGSRAVSALAPAVMPMIDEYMDDPEVQGILSGYGKQFGDALGGEGSGLSKLLEKAGPMMGRMAPRLGAAGLSEALALGGNAMGAPEEMWDPAIRRQNMMMSMRMPSGGKGAPNSTGAGAGSDGVLENYDAPQMMDLGGPSGVEDIGSGRGIDWDQSFAGAQVRGAPSGLKEPGAGGGNSGSQLGSAVGGALGGGGAGAALGAAFGAAEGLGKAPGAMANAAVDSASSTDALRAALGASSSTPQKAGNFGMRMGNFQAQSTPDFQAREQLRFESKPTTAEAGLMPRAPNPMQQHVQMPPATMTAKRPPMDSDGDTDNSTEEYTFPTQYVRGRGSSPGAPSGAGSSGGPREYAPPPRPQSGGAMVQNRPPVQKMGDMGTASSLLGALRPSRPPAYDSGVEEEQLNQTRERLRQPQMGIRYRR